jgi:two-component system, OmpR family, sensor histidine kinase MtrB
MAHELMSPVVTIQTTAQCLRAGYFGELSPEQQEGVATLLRNCQYLEDMLQGYVDLSMIELDALDFRGARVDLAREVVAEVLASHGYQANLKAMPIVTACAEVPPIIGDASLLRIVLGNLISNAIKYGQAGSEIRVGVSRDGDHATLSVYNHGVGISQGDIDTRLFGRFQRLRHAGTEGVKGSGIGLYLCKRIVEAHGGRIEADSVPGVYAEFRIRLNLA